MIKAVFFDIDGTLVPFGAKGIPSNTREAIEALRRKGIKVFISTGRHICWVDNLGDTEFDGYVTVNGGMCLLADKRTCIYKHAIDRDDIVRLVDYANRHRDLPFSVVPETGGIFFNVVNDTVRDILALLHVDDVTVEPIERALDHDVVQLMAFFSPDVMQRTRLFDDTLLSCTPTSWSPSFSDVIPTGSNKAVGIDRMLSHFGIDLSQTMAFGDGGNDISMLRHVAVGVAMGNASDDVKRIADYVTADVDRDGISVALRHFGII